MIQFFKRLFNLKTNKKHKAVLGSCYGVLTGKYVGELFVYIEELDDVMHFLSIPNMKNRSVPLEKYEYGINNRVLEYIERLPRNERRVCKMQFEINNETK